MRTRWECRYSSSEMLILEIGDDSFVRMYLHHSPQSATVASFADVLAGTLDGEASCFGVEVVEQLKAAVRERMANPPRPFDKRADMLRRRREG